MKIKRAKPIRLWAAIYDTRLNRYNLYASRASAQQWANAANGRVARVEIRELPTRGKREKP